jgi:hypothetical protein
VRYTLDVPSRSPRSSRQELFVSVIGRQTGGVIRGTSVAGAEIEADNLSVAASERVRPSESIVIARADARGRFAGGFPMRANDLVRLRARSPSGALSPPTTFRARGLPGAPRPLIVGVFRIGLRDLGNGNVRVFNLSPRRPIAEPGAVLSITNERTGGRVSLVMNAVGTIQGRAKIPGHAGDRLRVRAGDHDHGTLLTPSPERPRGRDRSEVVLPSGLHQKLGFVPTLRHFQTPLFHQPPRPHHVFQSELGNCYLASAVAAIAHVRPSCLERAIRRTKEGKYRVTFKGRDRAGRYAARAVVVSADLWVRPSGPLLYGSTAGLDAPPALWWPLIEKAFARLKGSYKRIGRGGTSHHVLEALLGRPPRHFYTDVLSAAAVWGELVRATAERLPVVVGTFAPNTARMYRKSGLYPDHAYAMLGCREIAGARRVALRNPWGEDVAAPGVVRKNGVLEIDFTRFMDLIEVVSTVR